MSNTNSEDRTPLCSPTDRDALFDLIVDVREGNDYLRIVGDASTDDIIDALQDPANRAAVLRALGHSDCEVSDG